MIFSETLEFDTFKEYLNSRFASAFASEYLNNLKPLQSEKDILASQSYFKEIFYILSSKNELKLPVDSEYSDFFARIKDPYATFTPEDFIIFKNFHTQVNNFKKEILDFEQIVHLKNITSNIYSFAEITAYISEKITDDAKVKDEASNSLFDIREKLRELRKTLTSSINKIFGRSDADKFIQERVVKEYNNRYVLLCKTNFRQYISGIVHSTSSSGQTVYVEPNFLVDLNNQYQDLAGKEDKEVRKILKGILDRIKSNIYEIVESVKSYSKLAFLFSVAQVYGSYKYCIPEISNEIVFDEIYHPLILFSKDKDAVPISLEMKNNTNLIIITGPNTGGKTAALKTVGLNTIIAKCGLPLFGRYAKVVNFKNILADIGDNQSLIMSLSTFSSHILNIKNILDEADANSLVLLDEVGTGTEPLEGAALALGTLKSLLEKSAKIIVTTHFSDIKTFGLKRDDCEIYSVDFDYKTFESSYKLLKGVVGKSSPIVIAKKLNFDEKAIEFANTYLNEKVSDKERMFEELNLLKAEIEREKLNIHEKEKMLAAKENEINVREAELKEKLELKEIKLLEETYLLLNKAKNAAESAKDVKSDKKFVEENLSKVKDKLDKLKDKKSIKDEISEGDNIFLEKYNKVAKILEIKKDNVLVDLQGIKVTLKKNEIIGKKIKPETEKNVRVKKDVKSSAKTEIVIIGKTVEEATDEVEKAIDKALLSNLSHLYIVHGRGSGALRKGVHEFLRTNPLIKSFRIGDNSEGGQAVTVVEL
ncbi:Smr/MutS family protein [Deferribacteraceae bacterium V6Fe1]|nr:Smr/MutS family protein [Deferribacteraceae bacterium V6Fe1]